MHPVKIIQSPFPIILHFMYCVLLVYYLEFRHFFGPCRYQLNTTYRGVLRRGPQLVQRVLIRYRQDYDLTFTARISHH